MIILIADNKQVKNTTKNYPIKINNVEGLAWDWLDRDQNNGDILLRKRIPFQNLHC